MADETDDLLGADEIEAMLNAAGAGASSAEDNAPATEATPDEKSATTEATATETADANLLGADEIEAMFNNAGVTPAAALPSNTDAVEAVLDQAEAQLAAAISPNLGRGIPPELGQPTTFSFQAFDSPTDAKNAEAGWDVLQDVELDLLVELGQTELLIEEVLKLQEGSIVPLDKLAGDPVDILVNGKLIARGEVLVLNDNFCVRVAEILAPED